MLVSDLFVWWYSTGWWRLARRQAVFIASILDSFSVAKLFRTLFLPFRQVSVGEISGTLDKRISGWLDLQVSRLVGLTVRLVLIITGLVVSMAVFLLSLIMLIIWPLLPVFPAFALIIYFGTQK